MIIDISNFVYTSEELAQIADIQEQLAAAANDPNLTITTEHIFYYTDFTTNQLQEGVEIENTVR